MTEQKKIKTQDNRLKTIDDYLDDFDNISGLKASYVGLGLAKEKARKAGVTIDSILYPNLQEIRHLEAIKEFLKQAMEAIVDSAQSNIKQSIQKMLDDNYCCECGNMNKVYSANRQLFFVRDVSLRSKDKEIESLKKENEELKARVTHEIQCYNELDTVLKSSKQEKLELLKEVYGKIPRVASLAAFARSIDKQIKELENP